MKLKLLDFSNCMSNGISILTRASSYLSKWFSNQMRLNFAFLKIPMLEATFVIFFCLLLEYLRVASCLLSNNPPGLKCGQLYGTLAAAAAATAELNISIQCVRKCQMLAFSHSYSSMWLHQRLSYSLSPLDSFFVREGAALLKLPSFCLPSFIHSKPTTFSDALAKNTHQTEYLSNTEPWKSYSPGLLCSSESRIIGFCCSKICKNFGWVYAVYVDQSTDLTLVQTSGWSCSNISSSSNNSSNSNSSSNSCAALQSISPKTTRSCARSSRLHPAELQTVSEPSNQSTDDLFAVQKGKWGSKIANGRSGLLAKRQGY